MIHSYWQCSLAALVLVSVSGCGLKGPLYRPGERSERIEQPQSTSGTSTSPATDPSQGDPESEPASGTEDASGGDVSPAESPRRRNTRPAPQSQKEDRERTVEPGESSTPTPPDPDRPAEIPPGVR